MAKKDFINKKFILRFTGEILHRVCTQQWSTIKDVADKLPYSYTYTRRAFNWEIWNYELFEEIAMAIWKTPQWYEQLNLDICEFVLNKSDADEFIRKFGIWRFENSYITTVIWEGLSHACVS